MHTTVPKKRTSVRLWRIDGPSSSTPAAEAAAAGDTSLLERSDHVDQVAQAAAEPVKAARRRACRLSACIPGTRLVELGRLRSGADVAEDPLAAGLVERVELQREVLLAGGAAGVADELTTGLPHGGAGMGRAIVREASDETARIGWSFPTGFAAALTARRRAVDFRRRPHERQKWGALLLRGYGVGW